MEAKDRGLSDGWAFTLGTLAGAAEIITEKVSLEALLDKSALGKEGFMRYLAKNVLAEGSEEAASDLINWSADLIYEALARTGLSEWETMIREIQAEKPGTSRETAIGIALGRRCEELGLDALGGALSGGLMAFGSGGKTWMQNRWNAARNGTGGELYADEDIPLIADKSPQAKQAETRQIYEALGLEAPETGNAVSDRPEESQTNVIVFSGNSALDSKKGLAYTLATNIEKIEDMNSVASLTGREMKSENSSASEQIRIFFSKIGNSVFRRGFGTVLFNEYGVGEILTHRPLNRAKMVSLTAVPQVIQGGRLIQETDSWKGRGYRSFVFAAPIEIAGTRVFVAAVVDQRPDNKFYLNEVVDSTGNFVRIKEIPIDGTKSGFTEKTE